MTIARQACVAALTLACVFAHPLTGRAAEKAESADGAKPSSTRRDAAEVVKEGDMSQWLQYYQRERGDGWSKTPAEPPGQTPASQAKPPEAQGLEAPAHEAQPPRATPR